MAGWLAGSRLTPVPIEFEYMDQNTFLICVSNHPYWIYYCKIIKFSCPFEHSRSKQRTDQRVLVLTIKFLALKKTGFSLIKNTSNFFCFVYLYSMQLSSADPTIELFFCP